MRPFGIFEAFIMLTEQSYFYASALLSPKYSFMASEQNCDYSSDELQIGAKADTDWNI